MTTDRPAGGPEQLARALHAALRAHPDVARLDGGVFGTVATYRPGGRLLGVRVGGPGEPVEVAVVLRLRRPIPEVVADLRGTVAAHCPGAPVDVTVSDVTLPGHAPPAVEAR